MLRRGFARHEYFRNPFIWNPVAEQVCHTAHKDGAWLFPALRLFQSITVKCGVEVIRIRFCLSTVSARRFKYSAFDFRLVQHMESSVTVPCIISHQLSIANISAPVCIRLQIEPPTSAEPPRNLSRIAVFAAVPATSYRIPCAVCPIYFCFSAHAFSSHGVFATSSGVGFLTQQRHVSPYV